MPAPSNPYAYSVLWHLAGMPYMRGARRTLKQMKIVSRVGNAAPTDGGVNLVLPQMDLETEVWLRAKESPGLFLYLQADGDWNWGVRIRTGLG